jgi:hypothetical protein
MITTPGHGSLPSGHCTEAYVIKEVLEALVFAVPASTSGPGGNLRLQFERMASRISTNRVVAGVHFPVDNVAGRLLGAVLGRYFVYNCGAMAGTERWPVFEGIFRGDEFKPDDDFDPLHQPIAPGAGPAFYTCQAIADLGQMAPPDSVLAPLWDAAKVELQRLQLSY